MNDIPKIKFSKRHHAKLEFEIIRLSDLFSRTPSLHSILEKPHRLEFFNILYIINGNGTHTIDFESYKFSKGSLFVISKGQVHSFAIGKLQDGYLIVFTENFLFNNLIHSDVFSLNRLYSSHLYSPIIQPKEFGKIPISNLIEEMYSEFIFPDQNGKEEILRSLLTVLLAKVERLRIDLSSRNNNTDRIKKFSEFKNLVEKEINKNREASHFAKLMHLTYKHLNYICKASAGISAKKYIDRLAILEIKRQFALSDISVNNLSDQFGFDEPTNFIKYFKKHTNITPYQFKLQQKK